MTGSGMPQRFTRSDGSMIDVYQGATQMTDESGQSYPYTPDTLLDRALGSQGYYGYFVANVHTDTPSIYEDTALLSSARSRGVPVVSARDVLEFVDGRNQSSFQDLSWNATELNFRIVVASGATNLTSMVPTAGPDGLVLSEIRQGVTPVAFQRTTIKGIEYATFPAAAATYRAVYAAPAAAPLIASALLTVSDDQSAVVEWSTDVPASSEIVYGTSPTKLTSTVSEGGSAGIHAVELTDLDSSETYYYRVISEDLDGTQSVWPNKSDPPAVLEMPAADQSAPTISDLSVSPRADGTALVRWTTNEPADSTVTVIDDHGDTVAEMYGKTRRHQTRRRRDRPRREHRVRHHGHEPRRSREPIVEVGHRTSLHQPGSRSRGRTWPPRSVSAR